MRILHAPLHAPSAAKHPRALKRAINRPRIDADLVCLTEAYPDNVLNALEEMSAWRTIIQDGGSDKRRGQYDNPILVDRALTSVGSGQVFGCSASDPDRISPERWFTFSSVAIGKQIFSHVSGHAHAVIQDKETGDFNDSKRAEVTEQEWLPNLDMLLSYLRQKSHVVSFSADANFRDATSNAKGIYQLLHYHKMQTFDFGLDVVACPNRLVATARKVKRPNSISDHPWILLEF